MGGPISPLALASATSMRVKGEAEAGEQAGPFAESGLKPA